MKIPRFFSSYRRNDNDKRLSRGRSTASAAGPRTLSVALAFLVIAVSFEAEAVHAQNLSEAQTGLVSQRLAEAAKLSWELGTRAQAILSLNASGFSVYDATPLPPPTSTDAFGPGNGSALPPFFDIARTTVKNRTDSNDGITGPQPLINDGSAADPASIGFVVLLSNWTQQDMGQVDYVGAAKDQLDFLFQKVPRTSDGAISHRVAEVQLWSDFVYMVPPFLAYYGAITRNHSLLLEAYNQIKLYRNHLRDDKAKGLWKHVLYGSFEDPRHWSTGNAWAAAGMLRVLATFQRSEFSNALKHQQKDIAKWVVEIQSAMYTHLDNTSIFTNYADVSPSEPGNFYDAASTALLASTVYRASLLFDYHHNLPMAERSRLALFASSPSSSSSETTSLPPSTSTSPPPSTSDTSTATFTSASASASQSSTSSPLDNMAHFSPDGYLTPVVNPHSFGVQGEKSAEAQAFVLELQAAWRDWVADGAKGANAARRTVSDGAVSGVWMGVAVGGWFGFNAAGII
ncbi:hypothetical protein AX17_001582 [Amanita inopinata Kibby_2008]|nr:hypothetical protein AX17_001582 [Amanita inopinata Kibby_2008]